MKPFFANPDSEQQLEQSGSVFADSAPLMPCDASDAYDLERIGRDRYCLTLAVPGLSDDDINVSADDGYLRISSVSLRSKAGGEVLHRGLDTHADRTFLMARPLELCGVDVRCGLLRVFLKEQPGTGVEACSFPRLQNFEALALAG